MQNRMNADSRLTMLLPRCGPATRQAGRHRSRVSAITADNGERRQGEPGEEAEQTPVPLAGCPAPSATATAIVPGPVVNGSVSGKNATSSSGPASDGFLLLAALTPLRRAQQLPSEPGQHETAGHAQRGHADAEEGQEVGAGPKRDQHDQQRIHPDPPRQERPARHASGPPSPRGR